MHTIDEVYIFGYGIYGEEISHALQSQGKKIIIIDQYQRHLKQAQKDGYDNRIQIDVHNNSSFEQFSFSAKSIVFCAFEDEAYNTYLTISLRSLFEDLTIIAIGESRESTHKLTMAGANKVIIVEETGANIIYNMIINPVVTNLFDAILYQDDGLSVGEITVSTDSVYDGVLLKDVALNEQFNLVLLGLVDQELGDTFIFATSSYNHKLDAGDVLVVLGDVVEIARCKETINQKQGRLN